MSSFLNYFLKKMSLRYNGLDDGRFGSARSDPFTSADFGAESGSYYLKSKPVTFKEYELDQDPRAPPNVPSLKPVPEKPKGASASKKKVRKVAAQVNEVPTAVEAPVGKAVETNSCSTISWDNFPSCTVKETYGFLKDTVSYVRGTSDFPSFFGVLTHNQRYMYILLAVLFGYLLYRVLRKC